MPYTTIVCQTYLNLESITEITDSGDGSSEVLCRFDSPSGSHAWVKGTDLAKAIWSSSNETLWLGPAIDLALAQSAQETLDTLRQDIEDLEP